MTNGIQIPPASLVNLEHMARAYYEQSRQLWRVIKGKELPDYDDLDEETRDIQISGMRAAYAALAVRGGADVESIGRVQDAQPDTDSEEPA